MGAPFGKSVVVTISATLLLICSCEKHHPGEYPEVQREKGAEGSPTAETNATASPAEAAKPSMTPTPAEFFPTKPR